MPLDLPWLAGVAWLVTSLGCGPAVRPDTVAHDPGPAVKVEPLPQKGKPVRGRQFVLGEMCPQGAGGRPAVLPLVMRTVSWSDTAEEVAAAVERGTVPRFVVFGVDGKTAGKFDTLGLADIGQLDVASGTYVGASPCTSDGGNSKRIEDPKCTAATSGCGIAIGDLGRPDDPPDTTAIATAGACLQGDALSVDIDGDKVMEQFPLAGVLDGIRSPAKEWSAAPVVGQKCTPVFSLFDIKIVPQLEPGKGSAAQHTVGVDVLAVADLDGDGRNELVLAMKFPTVRTIVIYSAESSPQRLELVGEGTSFPR